MKKLLLFASLMAIPFLGKSQTYFFDDFEDKDVSDWTRYDVDGDGIQWADYFTVNDSGGTPVTPVSLISRSWQSDALTPNNWIVSPAIDLSSASGQVFLYWKVKCAAATWDKEHYSVYVAKQSDLASLEASPVKFSETYDDPDNTGTQYNRALDVSSFVGETIYVAFRHHDVTDMDYISIDDVAVKAAPVAIPDCAVISSPANGATNVAITTRLTWSEVPNALGYKVYLGTTPGGTEIANGTIVNANSSAIFTLSLDTTYYAKVVPYNNAGDAAGCTEISFKTTAVPNYCTAAATSTSSLFEKISRVRYADIDNSSTSTAGYEDFTSIIGNVKRESNLPITVNISNYYTSDRIYVWIDYNQNGIFDDGMITLSNASAATGNITIPADAKLGQTRMRIRLNDSSSSSSNTTPCGTSNFGQVEDYTLNIEKADLAVADISRLSVKSYPNPVKDIFNIEAQGKIKTVKVFDAAGKQIFTKELNEAKSQIDFSRFTPGVYIVTTALQDGTSTSTKVIKK